MGKHHLFQSGALRSSGKLEPECQVCQQLLGSTVVVAGEVEGSPGVSLRHRRELAAGGECAVPASHGQADLAGTVTRLTSHPPPRQQWPSQLTAFLPQSRSVWRGTGQSYPCCCWQTKQDSMSGTE